MSILTLFQKSGVRSGPVPPVPGPLDFIVPQTGLTEFEQQFDLAEPGAIFGMAFRYTGDPVLTAQHGAEPLILSRLDKNPSTMVATALFYGDGLTIENAMLKVMATGGTIGPVIGRITDDLGNIPIQDGWKDGAVGMAYETTHLNITGSNGGGANHLWGSSSGTVPFSTSQPADLNDDLWWNRVVAGTSTKINAWTSIGSGWTDNGSGAATHTGSSGTLGANITFTPAGPIGFSVAVVMEAATTLMVTVWDGQKQTQRKYNGPYTGTIYDIVEGINEYDRITLTATGNVSIADFNHIKNPVPLTASIGRSTGPIVNGQELWYKSGVSSQYSTSAVEIYRSNRADKIAPTLEMDFMAQSYKTNGVSRSLSSIIDMSRSSSATYVGSDRFLKTAAANELRFAYDPVNGQFKGLLTEGPGTNIITRSEDFSHADWVKINTTISSNYGQAPDGLNTSSLLTEGAAGTAITSQSKAVVSGTRYCFSVFMRYTGTRWARIIFFETTAAVNQFALWVDLQNGAMGSSINGGNATSVHGGIEPFGNGWYRVSVSGILQTNSARAAICSAQDNGSATRVAGATYEAWGTQVEVGSYPTSYIPTVASSVTRSGDSSIASMSTFSTRAGTATFTGPTGLLTTAVANEVRYNYAPPYPSKSAAILLEPQKTNLVTNTSYPNLSGTVTMNNAVGPDGITNSASTYISNTGAGNKYVYSMPPHPTAVIGNFYSVSVYVKKVSGSDFVQITTTSSAGPVTFFVNFDLVKGEATFVGSTVAAYSIVPLANGWYRISAKFQATGTGGGAGVVLASVPAANSDRIPSFSGVNSFEVFGMQYETDDLTSYIPTAASSVTRTADVESAPSQQFLRFTREYTNSVWYKPNCTAENGQSGVLGTPSGGLITDTGGVNSYLAQIYTTSGAHANKTFTFSVYIKSGTKPGSFYIRIRDSSFYTVVGSTTITPTVNWERYTVTGTFGETAGSGVEVIIDPLDATTGGTYYIDAPVLNEGPVAGPIVYTGSNTYTVAGTINWLSLASGTYVTNALYESGPGASMWPGFTRMHSGENSNRITQFYDVGSRRVSADGYYNSASSFIFQSPANPAYNGTVNQAMAYRTNNSLTVDKGVALGAVDTVCQIPMTFFMAMASLPSGMSVYTKSIKYYPLRISDPELQRITGMSVFF